jgi:hypothetical protein
MDSVHRMPRRTNRDDEDTRPSNKVIDKKEKDKKPKHVVKKGRGGKGGDDSDVDEKGNIRGLIDYDFEEESDSSYEEEDELSSVSSVSERKPRKAALNARKRITKELAMERQRKTKGKVSLTSSSSESVRKSKKPVAKKAGGRKKTSNDFKAFEDEESEEEESAEEDDEDDEDEEDGETLGSEDTDTEDEDEEDERPARRATMGPGGNLILTIGAAEEDVASPMVPVRHNMKKEPEAVRKFVKLLTDPMEENTIDTQIDQFKALSQEKQKELLEALEKRPTTQDTGVNLMLKILTMKLPSEIQALVLAKYNALQYLDPSTSEYFKQRNWLDKIVSVPFGMYKEMPVTMEDGHDACAHFMQTAKSSLDDAVYGQDETKLQIMQYISTKIANPSGQGLSLLLVGPPGIGKTSLIKNGIAKALGWPFQFISLGGDSDASTYTGHQLVYESSHCGKIVNSLVAAKSMSCVLLFDEVDKISQTAKGEEIQNMLIHLTDPAANATFEDKYLAGVPIDLSKVMFVFSANDISKIDRVLLDRMMVIELKGYDVKQKLAIAENYLLPTALKEVGLGEKVAISKEILTYIVEEYAKEEQGVRELKRCIEQVTQKLNMLRMYNAKELPFHIPGFALPFVVKKDHIDLFLKKKEQNTTHLGMYM